jgi:hypothetical protein
MGNCGPEKVRKYMPLLCGALTGREIFLLAALIYTAAMRLPDALYRMHCPDNGRLRMSNSAVPSRDMVTDLTKERWNSRRDKRYRIFYFKYSILSASGENCLCIGMELF